MKALQAEPIFIAWQKFVTYFHDPVRQQNIYNAKEEQFQEGFLRELFVNILGYTLNPEPEYNLTTELKNEVGAKKADGAILNDGKALGVIELKGTDTRDLDKINEQAFSYKNNQTGCVYVITSNFEKLRFFIHNAVDHIEFNLFTLTEEEFSILWLCLQVDNLLNDIPLKVKEESLLAEEDITKQLYKDYSSFKTDLWQNLVRNNSDNDQLLLFKKTQKLLDRFLFIFFAEDSGLLPPNSISRIIKRWETLKEEDAYKPLYDIFKQYFGYINTGRKGKVLQDDIYAYNGGLFQDDLVLDRITIDDAVLFPHVMKLTGYDFQSEVDVNILGHIFENSLSEIENITTRLEGQELDKSKTKRKKDGVYYTPKYITKYIVDNTVGKLCEEKKTQLNITDGRFAQAGKRTEKGIADLQAYRDWLFNLKICDPACGSGAFLNQALDFLIKEHQYLDELTAQYHKSTIVLSDIETQILENNLYGVDINEESVEIARLSLWLRTAERGRKLTSLNHNIKCGNSLIDDPEIAGKKAFNWQIEFPSVFNNGGFDAVIGNPPYVRAELLGEFREFFSQNYQVFHSASDLFAYFYELGSNLIKPKEGLMGYISNTFDKTTAGKVLRDYLIQGTTFHNYIDFTEVQVFEGATTYPVIIILSKSNPTKNQFKYVKISKEKQSKVIEINKEQSIEVIQETLPPDTWAFFPKQKAILLSMLSKLPTIREKFGKCYYGVKTALNEAFIVRNNWPISDHIKYIYEGKEIKKWHAPAPEQKLILFKSKWTKAHYGFNFTEEQFQEKVSSGFPEIMEHLLHSEEKARKRYDKGEFWWELRNCAYYDLFDKPKIIFPNLQNANKFCLDSIGVFVNAPAVFLPVESKTLLCILNSRVVWEFLKSICVVRRGGYIEVKPQYFEQIPVPDFKNESEFEQETDRIIDLTGELQKKVIAFINLLQSKFNLEIFSKKIQNWYDLEFKDFLKELKNAKVQLSLSEEAEWMQYFNEQKQQALEMKSEINRIDAKIDQMVYELYGLTEEEISIAEQI